MHHLMPLHALMTIQFPLFVAAPSHHQVSPLPPPLSIPLPQWLPTVVAVEDNEEGCEVNGRLYRDGEVFQPSCKLQCRCLDGGFTCVPLCQEDVRLPTPDCPHPRRVDIPGKCCPEWVCEAGERHLLQSTGAGRRWDEVGSSNGRPLTAPLSVAWGT